MPLDPYIYPDELDDLRFEGGNRPPDLDVGDGPAPLYTGLLDATGAPIYRHAVVPRLGFHPERRRYWCPSLDRNYEDDSIMGWAYAS